MVNHDGDTEIVEGLILGHLGYGSHLIQRVEYDAIKTGRPSEITLLCHLLLQVKSRREFSLYTAG
jgi:hypothetical protein